MGLTVLRVDVANPAAPENARTLELFIDSGTSDSVVPANVLDELGIKPAGDKEFRLADGTTVHRKKGIAMFRHGDAAGGADVIFGEPGDHQVVGASTLAALGLVFDALTRELRQLPMILA